MVNQLLPFFVGRIDVCYRDNFVCLYLSLYITYIHIYIYVVYIHMHVFPPM